MLIPRLERWCGGLCVEWSAICGTHTCPLRTDQHLHQLVPGDAEGRPNSLCQVRRLAFQSQCVGRDSGGNTVLPYLGEEHPRC